MSNEQIYRITYNGKVSLVQAKNRQEAIAHVFDPYVERLSPVESVKAIQGGAVLEIAGEVAPLNQPQLTLGEQP